MIESILQFLLKNRAVTGLMLTTATAFILFLTLSPSDQIGDFSIYQYDKLGHFGLFFIWTFIFGLLMLSLKKIDTHLLVIFVAGSLFGILIEILQGALPINRTPNILDVISDIVGTLSATLLLLILKNRYIISGEKVLKKNKK
ncbi:MAG: VanZ family protein [Balneolaceae bacterium]